MKKPVISGGKLITGWELFDKTNNIYRANVGELKFRQLYINGKWGTRARNPNKSENSDLKWDNINKKIIIQKNNISKWDNFKDVEMVTINTWTANHLKLGSFIIENNEAQIALPQNEESVFRINGAFRGKNYFFENAYEFIDSPGEWYLNPSNHYLYYKAAQEEDINKDEIIVPLLDPIVKIEGSTYDKLAEEIHFNGISFMHGNWLRPNEFGNIEMQATQYFMPDSGPVEYTGRPSSGLVLKNAKHITFERCSFSNMGASGIDLISGCSQNTIVGCVFNDIAGNAISLGLTAKENESNMTVYKPTDERELPNNNKILNNYITRVGCDNSGAVGIFYGYAKNTIISNNEIENLPYTGISGGWGWDSTRTLMSGNSISHNYIHDYMKIYYDGAGIYTLSNQPNSNCENNYIENMGVGPRGYGWSTIYADEGSRNITIKNNVSEVKQAEKIQWLVLQSVFQGAKDCVVENNYTNSTTLHDNHQPVKGTQYFKDANWPVQAREIIQKAGISPEYNDIKKVTK